MGSPRGPGSHTFLPPANLFHKVEPTCRTWGSKPRDARNHVMFCTGILASGCRACADKMGPGKHGDKTRKSRNTRILGGSNPAGCRLNRLVLRSVNSRERTSGPLGPVTKNRHNNMHAQKRRERERREREENWGQTRTYYLCICAS